MKRITKLLIASLLVFVVSSFILSLVVINKRMTVSADGREDRESPNLISNNPLNMKVESEILTWDEVAGATGYQVVIKKNGYTIRSIDNVNSNSFFIISEMDSIKLDSGQYLIEVGAKGVDGKSGAIQYYYTSNVDKLESPVNLFWVGDKACWEYVPGASSYKLELYDFTHCVFSIYTTESPYDLSVYEPQAGWTFRVQALGDGKLTGKRNSSFSESPAKEERTRSLAEVASSNSFNLTITSSGLLTWDEVDGATGYQIILKQNGMQAAKFDTNNSYYYLVTEMDSLKLDSGDYTIDVAAKGVLNKSCSMQYLYTSHVDKLESPHGLYWWGYKARWEEVPGATSYRVSLYDFSGLVSSTYTTELIYDFEGNKPQDGWTFKVQALGDGTFNAKRNSNVIESPALIAAKYDIGVVIADTTLDINNSGGQVYFESNKAIVDWTTSGGFSNKVATGTEVTIKAKPNPDYIFLGWQLNYTWVSSDLEYTFVAGEDAVYYAMFQKLDQYFVLQPVSHTVAKNTTINIPWTTNFTPTKTEIEYWDVEKEIWDQWDVNTPTGTSDDYDFQYENAETFRFHLVAYIDSTIIATSDEFIIAWVEPKIEVAEATAIFPVGGASPVFTMTTEDGRFTVSVYSWVDDTTYERLKPTDIFVAGKKYQLNALFEEKEGYSFTEETIFKINGEVIDMRWGGGLGMRKHFITAATPDEKEYNVLYNMGEGSGSNDLDIVSAGTVITLKTPQDLGFIAPEGKVFDAWEINENRYEPGEEYTINAETIIIALWKNAPVTLVSLSATYDGENIVVGNKINPSDIYIKITYSNSDEAIINPGDVEYYYQGEKISDPVNYVFASAGLYQITVKYLDKETTMNVTVVDPVAPKTLTSIEISGTYKTEYIVGETFTTKGMIVKAIYSNGDKEDIDLNEVVFTGYNLNEIGNQTITATWSEKTYQFQIQVIDGQIKTYTISFSSNGGEGSMAPIENANGKYTLPVCTFTAPQGKEFECWIVDGENKNPGDVIEISENTTINAKWKDIESSENIPTTPKDNKKISAGAVVVIVIVSAIVLGIGGFAVVWFVINKKTWQDFISLFSKK